MSIQMRLPSERGMSLLGVLSCPGNVMMLIIVQLPNLNFPKLLSQSSPNCKLARWVEEKLPPLYHRSELRPTEGQGCAHWHREVNCPSHWLHHQHYKRVQSWGRGSGECVTDLGPLSPTTGLLGTQSLWALVSFAVKGARCTDCVLILGWGRAVGMGQFGARSRLGCIGTNGGF